MSQPNPSNEDVKMETTPGSTDNRNNISNKATLDLAKNLQERHKHVLNGNPNSWMQYAKFVLTAEPPKRKELIEQVPLEVMRYFPIADSLTSTQQLQLMRRSVIVAKRVNSGYEKPIRELAKDVNKIIEDMERNLAYMKTLKDRILSLENQLKSTEELLKVIGESVGPI